MSEGANWERILQFIALVQNADADIGALGWALNAHAVRKLRSSPRFANTAMPGDTVITDQVIMDAPAALAGFPAAVTSALAGDPGDGSDATDATIIFGAWSQLLVGYWSGVDVLINPYEGTAYARGRVLVRAMRDCDVAVRHAEAFAFGDTMPVTLYEAVTE